MTVRLTASEITRFNAVADAMLSAGASAQPERWWAGVDESLQRLFPGARAMLSLGEGTRLRGMSASLDGTALRRLEAFNEVDSRTGHFITHCPVVEVWNRERRARRMAVWNERVNRAMLAELGLDLWRSAFLNEGLRAAGLHELSGMASEQASAELFVSVGYARPGQGSVEADTARLALLVPALRAAHSGLLLFGARQNAFAATLDAMADALLVVGASGREHHRNRALGQRLARDPERDAIVAAMLEAARSVRAVRAPARAASPPGAVGATRTLATAVARYTVRASFVPEALWGETGAIVVSLVAESAADAIASDAATLGARFGLTAREAEVAQLLAQRLSAAELAAALGISTHTARRHTERVMAKLGVRSRRHLAAALAAPPE